MFEYMLFHFSFLWYHLILPFYFQFKCCGPYGNENSTTSWYLYQKESFWFKDGYNSKFIVFPSAAVKKKEQNIDINITPDKAHFFS